MKNIIAIFLSLLVAATAFKDLVVIASFKANQQYIATNLCVNQNKPELSCHGKCFLNAQLDKEEKRDKSIPYSSFENKQQPIYYISTNIKWPELNQRYNKLNKFSINEDRPLNGYLSAVFRPPEV